MIKKALEYLMEEKSKANTFCIGGETYSDKPLHRINHNPKAEPIGLRTLSSLVDYIHSGFDSRENVFVHVDSPTIIRVFSSLDMDREREYLVTVEAEVPYFKFNQFMDHEEFCIALQSKFVNNPDRALLLKFAGTVEAGSVAEYGDDGVTQKATVKTGIASKGDAIVPNPVTLAAYRTFNEVEQPETQYVFRMKQDGSGVRCALFEADGGAWRNEAMLNIKEYLVKEFEGVENLVVIC